MECLHVLTRAPHGIQATGETRRRAYYAAMLDGLGNQDIDFADHAWEFFKRHPKH